MTTGGSIEMIIAETYASGLNRRREADVQTRSTVQQLTFRGLEESQAANVTAFLCGIPVADRGWKLREVNELLFLRELHQRGRFGPADESPY
jgi:hypothetical protein